MSTTSFIPSKKTGISLVGMVAISAASTFLLGRSFRFVTCVQGTLFTISQLFAFYIGAKIANECLTNEYLGRGIHFVATLIIPFATAHLSGVRDPLTITALFGMYFISQNTFAAIFDDEPMILTWGKNP